ncbi:66S preribosome component LOC1 [Arthroderma uncinatum]|uniref:66S preribosome component LOC1 n=1 Tax=Arthroderma uncinatum TaxID=74035 RepID=UPI00144AC2CD|nr:66S preribosome component LOC1 [Arthroderma uncinatum]KAF3483715.1 66S preribosome component LOC1 [Arthroderma uncinatum]
MAPTRPSGASKSSNSKSSKSKPTSGGKSSTRRVSKPKSGGKSGAKPKPTEVKAKSRAAPEVLKKKKKRVYTEKELNLPTLNKITPVGVQKPRGKKKGKVFVDDQESMMTILAMVNAEKEGQIESRMIKARHMEEIREARRAEAEVRKEHKNAKLEETKDSLRKSRKSKDKKDSKASEQKNDTESKKSGKSKRVAFA